MRVDPECKVCGGSGRMNQGGGPLGHIPCWKCNEDKSTSAPREERSEREKYRDLLFENAMRLLVAHWSQDKHCVDSVAANAVHDAYMDAECRAAERYPEEPEAAPAPTVEVRVGQVWRTPNGAHIQITKEHMASPGVVACFLGAHGFTLVSDAPGAGEETA